VFLVIGNALPKILTPLAILPLQLAERVTAARRFIGMTWFALGIVMAVAFLFQPLELAKTLERWSILGGLLTMLGAIIRMNLGAGRHVQ
jgi:predicted permease